MKWYSRLLIVLCLSACEPALYANVSKSDNVSFSIISPVDNSLWIATRDRGILRLGSNGKCFVYSVAKGDFPSDSISVLSFDSDGKLWMRDASGRVFNYSSLDGFVLRSEVPAGLFDSADKHTVEVGDISSASPSSYSVIKEEEGGFKRWYLVVFLIAVAAAVIAFFKPGFRIAKASNSCPVDFAKGTPGADSPESDCPQNAPRAVNVSNSNVDNSNSSNRVFYEKVLALVIDNLSDPDFGVDSIALATGLSRVHVNRKLKASGGVSPSSLIKSERMKKASALLAEGSMPITEIATACGFSSQAYFSAAFKEYFGVSPSAYTAK